VQDPTQSPISICVAASHVAVGRQTPPAAITSARQPTLTPAGPKTDQLLSSAWQDGTSPRTHTTELTNQSPPVRQGCRTRHAIGATRGRNQWIGHSGLALERRSPRARRALGKSGDARSGAVWFLLEGQCRFDLCTAGCRVNWLVRCLRDVVVPVAAYSIPWSPLTPSSCAHLSCTSLPPSLPVVSGIPCSCGAPSR